MDNVGSEAMEQYESILSQLENQMSSQNHPSSSSQLRGRSPSRMPRSDPYHHRSISPNALHPAVIFHTVIVLPRGRSPVRESLDSALLQRGDAAD